MTGLSKDPRDRLGVFKRYSDVPDRYRFYQYEDQYEGRDVWNTCMQTHVFPQYDSETTRTLAERSGRAWKRHMSERERHHALAQPEDVATWCDHLLADRKAETVYNHYWVRLEDFYTWLQQRVDHPHKYHPVLMAAAHYEAAGIVWDAKMSHR